MSEARTPILEMQSIRMSLEDIFLKVTGNSESGSSIVQEKEVEAEISTEISAKISTEISAENTLVENKLAENKLAENKLVENKLTENTFEKNRLIEHGSIDNLAAGSMLELDNNAVVVGKNTANIDKQEVDKNAGNL
jgi:hypothetical protein